MECFVNLFRYIFKKYIFFKYSDCFLVSDGVAFSLNDKKQLAPSLRYSHDVVAILKMV